MVTDKTKTEDLTNAEEIIETDPFSSTVEPISETPTNQPLEQSRADAGINRILEDLERRDTERSAAVMQAIAKMERKMEQSEKKVQQEIDVLKKRATLPIEDMSSSKIRVEKALKKFIHEFGLDDSSKEILAGDDDQEIIRYTLLSLGKTLRKLSEEKDYFNSELVEGVEDTYAKVKQACREDLKGEADNNFSLFLRLCDSREKKYEQDEQKAYYLSLSASYFSWVLLHLIPPSILEEGERYYE